MSSAVTSNADVQKAHYDEIMARYEAHYDDPTSQAYRRRFLYEPMCEGLDLDGANTLEAMCGSGQMTDFLLGRGAKVTGLDLSSEGIVRFEAAHPECSSIEASVLDTGIPDETYDAVFIIGGLHHVADQVDEAVLEMHRVLKPGGALCFGEPHAGSIMDTVRRLWYRFDHSFEEGEEAIDVEALSERHKDIFTCELTRYLGTVAYISVLNSMILRVPLWSKKYYAPPMSAVESLVAPVLGKRTTCFSVCRWIKTDSPAS